MWLALWNVNLLDKIKLFFPGCEVEEGYIDVRVGEPIREQGCLLNQIMVRENRPF